MPGLLDPTIRELLAGRPLTTIGPEEVVAARSAFVAELLYEAGRRGEVAWVGDAEFALAARALHSEAQHARMCAAIRTVAKAHELAGLPLRIFKGAAIGAAVYESPIERPFDDVDIYVDSSMPEQLLALLYSLGVPPVAADSAVSLAVDGCPIHEFQAVVNGVAIDIHFTPYGLLTPLRSEGLIASNFVDGVVTGDVPCQVPTPALALAIAAANLARKGGGSLWTAGDIARLVDRSDMDWRAFAALLEAEGLTQICHGAILAVVEDLALDIDLPIVDLERPPWAPVLGEGAVSHSWRRRSTLVPFRRPMRFFPESLRYLVRWYLPTPRVLEARNPELSGTYPARLAKHMTSAQKLARKKRSAFLEAGR